jgi:hypothetical protein
MVGIAFAFVAACASKPPEQHAWFGPLGDCRTSCGNECAHQSEIFVLCESLCDKKCAPPNQLSPLRAPGDAGLDGP